ncbi:MAG: glycosyltransferase [Clostridia bacterium]|nr:glycosyltransferase [Clostridia bacterium]
MRILEVVDNYYPNTDGVVLVVDNYARLLNKKEGVECVVLAPRYPGAPKADGYELVTCFSISGGIFGPRLPLPVFDGNLRKYLKNETFDLIHCHSPATLAKYIVRYAKKRNIPLLFTVHTKYHEEINRFLKLNFLQKAILKYTLSSVKKMDYYWAVSKNVREVLTDRYGILVPCKVMRNGTDMTPDCADPKRVEEIKRRFGLQKEDFVLMTAGRIVSIKNFQTVISAVAILRDKGISVKMLLVGDGDYKHALKELVKKLDLTDRVFFIDKTNDRHELAAYYAACDIVPLASTFDTSSLVIREGFAFGKPAMVVRGSAPAEGITDNVNGYLCENTPESFADKILSVAQNRDNLKVVSENCFRDLYTPWEKIVDDVAAEYEKILEDFAKAAE